MKAKEGVDLRFLSTPAWWAAHVADQLHGEVTGRQAVITSTGEGKHEVERSRHYTGQFGFGFAQAFDLRVWYISHVEGFARRLQDALGVDYVVLAEYRTDQNQQRVPSHIHVHWAPVYRERA